MSRILSFLLVLTLLMPTLETVVSALGFMEQSTCWSEFYQEAEEENKESEEEKKEIDNLPPVSHNRFALSSDNVRVFCSDYLHHSWISEIASPPPEC
jgi:hypothetical protein